MWCLFTKPEHLLIRLCILPLKCCACGTSTFLGAAFPSALASQRLLPSSSGDSSPLLSESSSSADAFCPFKELSSVPAGFAGLASAVLAFQPGWQVPGSSCPSDAVSVGIDKTSSSSTQEEAPSHTHTHVEKPPAEMEGTNCAVGFPALQLHPPTPPVVTGMHRHSQPLQHPQTQPPTQPYLMAGCSTGQSCEGLNWGGCLLWTSQKGTQWCDPSCAARRAWHWL